MDDETTKRLDEITADRPIPKFPEDPPQPKKLRVLSGLRTIASLTAPGRTVKMVMPICETCQHGKIPSDWWKYCKHEPYETLSENVIRTRKTDDRTNEDGSVTRVIVGWEETVELVATVNLTQVPMTKRHDSGKGLSMAQAGGFRRVEDFDLAPFCEYRECWSQVINVRSRYGNYCSEIHAKVAAAEMMGKILDIMDDERREEQLAGISV